MGFSSVTRTATSGSTQTVESANRLAYLALAAVCLFWGTTYLAIRLALDSFPPLYLIATRYTISGALLLAALALLRFRMPSRRAFVLTAICGIVCIGIGNGLLAIAQTIVPSGYAALCYTAAPFWMVGIDALLPAGRRPQTITLLGLLIGLCGVSILVAPGAVAYGLHGALVVGFFLLQISMAGWVTGSLLQKRMASLAHPIVTGAIQQLAAGVATLIPAALLEHAPQNVSSVSALAVAYLIVFGSFIGFTSFVYSVANLPVAIVSIYFFVNPIVAVFLGWLVLHEHFGLREFAAMCIIFAGVAIVRLSESRRERAIARPAS